MNVCFWDKADITRLGFNVRFRGNSGHGRDLLPCALMTLTQPSFRSEMWYPHRARFVSVAMTTSTHSYHGYELALHHESDDRYRVTIFDPKGNRIASTGMHLERQGALTEASRRVNQFLAQRRTTSGSFPRH